MKNSVRISMKLLIVPLFILLFDPASAREWKDECQNPNWGRVTDDYCACVGKLVSDRTTKLKVGKIIGVAWRPKGSVIGNTDRRTSPRNAFFYIVEDAMPEPFLKDPRQSRFSDRDTVWCEK